MIQDLSILYFNPFLAGVWDQRGKIYNTKTITTDFYVYSSSKYYLVCLCLLSLSLSPCLTHWELLALAGNTENTTAVDSFYLNLITHRNYSWDCISLSVNYWDTFWAEQFPELWFGQMVGKEVFLFYSLDGKLKSKNCSLFKIIQSLWKRLKTNLYNSKLCLNVNFLLII